MADSAGNTPLARETPIQRLQHGLVAFNATGEIPSFPMAPDFEVHQASSIVDTAGVFRGRDAVQRTLAELGESFEELSFVGERFLEAPGGEIVVLVHVKGRGRASGLEIDNRIAWVWTFREEAATRLVVYEEPEQALRAVGLSG